MFSLCFLRCLLLDAPSLCSLAKHSSMSPPILLGLDAGVLQVPCRGLAAADCLPGEVQPARPVAGGRDHSVPADVCERLGLSPWRDCRCHSAVVCRSRLSLYCRSTVIYCHLRSPLPFLLAMTVWPGAGHSAVESACLACARHLFPACEPAVPIESASISLNECRLFWLCRECGCTAVSDRIPTQRTHWFSHGTCTISQHAALAHSQILRWRPACWRTPTLRAAAKPRRPRRPWPHSQDWPRLSGRSRVPVMAAPLASL